MAASRLSNDSDNQFDQSQLNTIRRHKDRATYDKGQIAEIFREAKICHISFIHDHLPQCIPVVAALEETEEGDLFVYIHGDISLANLPYTIVYWPQRVSKGSLHPSSA